MIPACVSTANTSFFSIYPSETAPRLVEQARLRFLASTFKAPPAESLLGRLHALARLSLY